MKHLLTVGLFAIILLVLSCDPQPKSSATQDAPAVDWACKTIASPRDTGRSDRAVSMRGKAWPNGTVLRVGYVDQYGGPSQRTLFEQCCADWAKVCNIKFTFPTAGPYDVRVAFNPGGGAWSYVGTDCRNVPQSSPTMNLGWTARDAYLHEIGHTLSLAHEHQNPQGKIQWNEPAVIKELSGPPNNWSIDVIRYNVLDPLPATNVIATSLDQVSIMMYPIPARWTLNGFSSTGGKVISEIDAAFIGQLYPFTANPPNPPNPPTGGICLTRAQADSLKVAAANAEAAAQRVRTLINATMKTPKK